MLSGKKTLSILMAALMCAGAMAGCTSSTPNSSTPVSNSPSASTTPSTSASASTSGGTSSEAPAQPASYDKEVTLEILRRGDVPTEPVEYLLDELLKEKFNMVWKNSYVAGNDMATKLSTLYASGMEPDFIWAVRPSWGSDDWTDAGYFRGFTQEEILNLIPGYEHLWDSQGEGIFKGYLWDYLSWSDGKIYTLPTARDTAGNMAWMYRKDVFDKCGITSFPTNPDEFLQVCRTIKEKMNITPLVDTNANLFVVSKWGMMYGLPDMLPDMPTFKNPVTGEYYDYVYDSDTYRDLLKLASTLVAEGLMYSEFATAEADQRDAYVGLGNKAIMFDYPANIAKSNKLQKDTVPDVDWQWTDVVPSISTEKQAIKKDNYHAADLRAFAFSADDDQVERMCAFLQWSTTDEGITFHQYGIEGKTYDVVDGKKQIKDQFQTPLKAEGDDLKKWQIGGSGMWKGTEYIETYQPVLAEWTEKILNNPSHVYVMPPVMKYTEEEQAREAELKTNLTEVVNRWLLLFMLGQKDINNDAHWDEYKAELKSLGSDELRTIYKTVYERSGNEM
jgi:putative aldouronate transport system substrate-binding protein